MIVTVITGASSGIGKALALKAIHDKHIVIVNARRAEPLRELQFLAEDQVHLVVGDITKAQTQEELFQKANSFGKVDYLFNNAGYGWYGLLEKQSNVSEMINLNVTALIQTTQKLLPLLKKSESGRILNIASVVGRIELPFMSTYVASKFAVVGFTKSLNLELANTSVTASAVCPPGTRTEFAEVALGKEKATRADRLSQSVETVASGIWRQKKSHRDVIYPTLLSGLTVLTVKIFHPFIKFIVKNIVRRKGENVI